MSPASASFELERFAATPMTDASVLLEIEGLLLGVPPRSASPRLLVEGTRRSRQEHDALESTMDGERLRASFIVPAASAETAGFALAVGGLLLELPAPDPTPGADRTVALARELNGARRELTRLRAHVEADAETARGHASELAAAREEAVARERAAVEAAEARAATAEQDAAERVASAEAEARERIAALEESAGARESELEVVASQLETVLADVRQGAEQRDAAAAAERRELEAELQAARAELAAAVEEAATAREEADAVAAQAGDSTAALAGMRSELEIAQRGLDARDAELSRSPDRRARAVTRPRTVAGATGEHPSVALPEPGPEDGGPARADDEDGAEATVAAPVDELGSEKTAATPVDGTETMDIEEASDEAPAQPAEPDADEGDPVARDGEAEPIDEADPTPDDGEFDDATVAHEAVPSRGADLEPPDDTGPIPLRRGSQRRYVPRSDRDEELGGDAVRVLGRDRPRASPLPPPPDADPGPPVGPDGRTLVLAAFAAAALLLLIVLLL